MNSHPSGESAVNMIKAGLESGTIKLIGNQTNGGTPEVSRSEAAAAADAAYLLTLFRALTGKSTI